MALLLLFQDCLVPQFGFASKMHEIGAEFTKYMKLVLGLQIHFGESHEMPRGRCAETFLW